MGRPPTLSTGRDQQTSAAPPLTGQDGPAPSDEQQSGAHPDKDRQQKQGPGDHGSISFKNGPPGGQIAGGPP